MAVLELFVSSFACLRHRLWNISTVGAVSRVVIVGERENLNLPLMNRLQHLNPLGQLRPTVHDDLVPYFRLLLDSFPISKPANIRKVGCDGVELLEPLCGPRHPALIDQGQSYTAFPQHFDKLWYEPSLVSDFDCAADYLKLSFEQVAEKLGVDFSKSKNGRTWEAECREVFDRERED